MDWFVVVLGGVLLGLGAIGLGLFPRPLALTDKVTIAVTIIAGVTGVVLGVISR